ncbi:MAG: UvrD-helicase domain-containing protein [Alphaproteobacteria bacterium]|nr:MAG: UvrD-helicase domain-containing protein [Alphaproteobacteria bacterium]
MATDASGNSLDLATLNPQQKEAILHVTGPLLVLAGAGTGKTRVLTTRLGNLITHQKVPPANILAVTFTNKASHEMRMRVEKMIAYPTSGLWIGTFHALCVRMLRIHAERVGRTAGFSILDTDDQQRLIKQLLEAENIDIKKYPPRLILSIISRWKDKALTAEKITQHEGGSPAAHVYPLYQARLKTLNAFDFGDLLMMALELFARYPDVLERYQAQFQYVLVDEYQDTNTAQYLWLKALAGSSHNICCVGDEDQSIYGWRGAEITNILRFEKDFPGAKVIRLEQNYRSTGHILGAASGLIAKNKERLGKELWTEYDAGAKVQLKNVWESEEEALYVADTIESIQRAGEHLSDTAVLVRAAYQTREFEERFLIAGIPYKVVGGARFYERQEIRDAIAYLRLIARPNDGMAFERIVNVPRRGIGGATLQVLHTTARHAHWSLPEAALQLIETDELKAGVRTKLRDFFGFIHRMRGVMREMAPAEFAKVMLEESGYVSMWQNDKSPDSPGRLDNLKELVTALEGFENIDGFLDHVSLVADNLANARTDVVTVMTLHAAKGLEFSHVFLTGWEEGVFPNPRALDDLGRAGLEEERRLAYVGLTRARRKAYITYAVNRRIQGRWQSNPPSRFITEIPPHHIETHGSLACNPRSTSYTHMPSRAPSFSQRRFVRSSESDYTVGERVFHDKFGYGHIKSVEDDKLSVFFDHTGLKKVLASFLTKAQG